MILIDALYIHNGGGKILLIQLIKRVEELNIKATLLLDKRIDFDFDISYFTVIFIDSSIFRRHIFYFKNHRKFNTIFCFANIPPSIKCDAKVITFFQNVLLLNPIKPSTSLLFKKLYLKLFHKNTDSWIVQTMHVEKLINEQISSKCNIFVKPFFKIKKHINQFPCTQIQDGNEIKLLYVSSGELHKNHQNLFKAFYKFNSLYPTSSLTVTIGDEYFDLCNVIKMYNNLKINIINKGVLNSEQLHHEYLNANVAIFPSFAESFGLGLIEAAQYNLLIIGSDLPYLHEVIYADFVFDPYNVDELFSSICKVINHKSALIERKKINDNLDSILNLLTNK